jgi:hypothetical protein
MIQPIQTMALPSQRHNRSSYYCYCPALRFFARYLAFDAVEVMDQGKNGQLKGMEVDVQRCSPGGLLWAIMLALRSRFWYSICQTFDYFRHLGHQSNTSLL